MTQAKNSKKETTTLCEPVTLPVGILINGVRHRDVELRPITLGQSYAASMNAKATDLQVLVDLSVMTYVPALGRHLSYDELENASRQDGIRLEAGRAELEKKEREQAITAA